MNYQKVLDEIAVELDASEAQGKVASYIPELAKVDPDKFGMYLQDASGNHAQFGDSEEKFSIQSISKVFTLGMAMRLKGDDLWKRVNVEPSGNPFNSLMQLEYEKGIPRNPFINAGALVISDILVEHFEEPKYELLKMLRRITGTVNIHFDEEVAASEMQTGYRNVALINYLKSLGNIRCNIDKVLDFYFHQCSITMTCSELAKSFMVFVNNGKLMNSDTRILPERTVRRINAMMQTCGFYDESGEFSFQVGLPGKSGVGGGIVAVNPNLYSVAVWSPKLNEKGNSELGMRALEKLTTLTETSVF